jgi:hypothetical protein
LASSGDDRSLKNPEELVGMPVGMTTGTRESFSAGGAGIIEGDTAALEWCRGGVVELNGRFYDWFTPIRKIDVRDGILNSIEDPSFGWSSLLIRPERNASRNRPHFNMSQNFATRGVYGEDFV